MKIEGSLRTIYGDSYTEYQALKTAVDNACATIKRARWHYESRIKELESYAIKICSGRFPDPANLEDFLACTFVVPNSASINDAIAAIQSRFEIVRRRPPIPDETAKRADSFQFDDLRLYCRRGNDGTTKPAPFDNLVFEIQVKTFLQHAWGIATHDLTYKTDDVRWGKDRIVAHLKAAIEYAEISIQQADEISRSPALQLTDKETKKLNSIIEIFRENWPSAELPKNLRGLAQSLLEALTDLKISTRDLTLLIRKERAEHNFPPSNLSPYTALVELLFRRMTAEVSKALAQKEGRKKFVLLPEMNVPAEFRGVEYAKRLVFVGKPDVDSASSAKSFGDGDFN